jgi:DNA replication protein DnaC
MQIEQLIERMKSLKFNGMSEALQHLTDTNTSSLSFEEKLAILLDREVLNRENKRLEGLLKQAKFRQKNASVEDVIWRSDRGLNQSKVMSLCNGNFIHHKFNLLITGATGCGKTYLACAIGRHLCQLGYRIHYIHLPKFVEEVSLARLDGSLMKLMKQYQKYDAIILDDFGLTPITQTQRHDLFSLIEDRYQLKSTIITSQLPISKWHAYLAEPSLADAILDRVLEKVERIELEGESLRKSQKLDLS